MFIEQNQTQLSKKYNIFSPSQRILVPKKSSKKQKQKTEIKLVFHHPNLLFLNPKDNKSRDQMENFAEDIPQQNLKKNQENQRYRPFTSYQSLKESKWSTKPSGRNTPHSKRSHTEQTLEIYGKSSCIPNQRLKRQQKKFKFEKRAYNTFAKSKKIEQKAIFELMEGKKGEAKKQTWRQLIYGQNHKFAVRLNIHLQAQKNYLKYKVN